MPFTYQPISVVRRWWGPEIISLDLFEVLPMKVTLRMRSCSEDSWNLTFMNTTSCRSRGFHTNSTILAYTMHTRIIYDHQSLGYETQPKRLDGSPRSTPFIAVSPSMFTGLAAGSRNIQLIAENMHPFDPITMANVAGFLLSTVFLDHIFIYIYIYQPMIWFGGLFFCPNH